MKVSMSPDAIHARLALASQLADLRPERRLHAKLDMSPEGIHRRLRVASELSKLCEVLAAANPELPERARLRDAGPLPDHVREAMRAAGVEVL